MEFELLEGYNYDQGQNESPSFVITVSYLGSLSKEIEEEQ